VKASNGNHPTSELTAATPARRNSFWKTALQQRWLYLMSIPFIIYVFIFSYLPLWGWTYAFQNYKPHLSFSEQQWVGFEHFVRLFSDEKFYQVLRNTLAMSFLGLIAGFTIPIIFALLLNEVRSSIFKRFVQTVSYLPHFVSWVVVASLVTTILSIDGGVVNDLLLSLGIIDAPINFMGKGEWFWYILTAVDQWKEMGWSAIIYLAAMAGIDPELYEAAKVDGAGRLRMMWNITLPSIRSTIIVLLIMSIGHLTTIGFEKQFLLGNNLTKEYSDVLDLYALTYGINLGRYSFGTAIGVFNSVVSIILLLVANGIMKRTTKESIM
jgi:putative aldouronate transport system permease protein